MRLVAGVLALSLFASFARAEDTEDARAVEPAGPAADGTYHKVPLRVVRIMAQSRQALLFDRSRATHVLAEVGGKIGGYTVEAIDDDEVTLSFEGKQIVLVAPAHGGDRRHDRDVPDMRAPSAADARQVAPAASEPAPIDPYRESPVRVDLTQGAPGGGEPGHAPRVIEAGQGGVRVAEAPGSTANPPTSSTEVPAPHADAPDARPPETRPAATRSADARPTGIRVAEAPTGALSAAGAPSAAGASSVPDAPDAPTSDARAVDATAKAADATAKANDARQGPQPAPTSDARAADATAGQGGIRVDEAPASVPSATPANEARAIETRAPEIKAPEVGAADAARAPDRQTLDARAMADVMSADHRSRGPRAPAAGALRAATPPSAADPRPASPASDIRTAAAAPGGTAVLSRSEVDGALADFAKLATAVRGSFTASGLVVDAVTEDSIFARAGLRAGDVVTVVDGAPLRSLDAAADLYARASTTKAFTAQIVRGGSPLTLHVAIQ